jgi:hypothetical protein
MIIELGLVLDELLLLLLLLVSIRDMMLDRIWSRFKIAGCASWFGTDEASPFMIEIVRFGEKKCGLRNYMG